jgi:hypothetical protein
MPFITFCTLTSAQFYFRLFSFDMSFPAGASDRLKTGLRGLEKRIIQTLIWIGLIVLDLKMIDFLQQM